MTPGGRVCYSSIQAVMSSFPALLSTIEEIANESNARGKEAYFIKSRHFLSFYHLYSSRKSSNLLQSEHISFTAATSFIRATTKVASDQTQSGKRSAKTLADKFGINITAPPTRPRRTHRIPNIYRINV